MTIRKNGFGALPVESKGAQEQVVKWITDKLDEAGYAGLPVTIKSDQEPAIKALVQAAVQANVQTAVQPGLRRERAERDGDRRAPGFHLCQTQDSAFSCGLSAPNSLRMCANIRREFPANLLTELRIP